MSNCVVGSVGLRLPHSIIAEHSVEGSDRPALSRGSNGLRRSRGLARDPGDSRRPMSTSTAPPPIAKVVSSEQLAIAD
jgi:hypothetical protein